MKGWLRPLLVVPLVLGVFLVWSLLAKPDSTGASAPDQHAAVEPVGPAGGGSGGAPAVPPVPAEGAAIALSPSATYAERFAVLCAACHGPNVRIEALVIPAVAGQPSLYVITQLFLFREGRRSNEAMTAVAKTLTDDDLRGFSEFIETLPPVPPPPPATPPDPIRMAKGQELAEQHKCLACHGPGLQGGEQVPRIAGQREDYLQDTLRGFHSGTRPGYTQAMTAAVSQIPPEDLDTLAYFASRFRGPAGAPAEK